MGEMIERVAKAIDPHAFADWQRRFDYEMGKSGDAIEAKAFADWGGGSRKSEALEKARAAIEAMKITDTVEGVPGGIAFEDAFFGSDETVFHAMAAGWNATIDAALSPPVVDPHGTGV